MHSTFVFKSVAQLALVCNNLCCVSLQYLVIVSTDGEIGRDTHGRDINRS